MNWYYAQAGKQEGPLNDAQLAQMVAMGTITAQTLVWHEGMADWLPYARVAVEEGLAEAQPDSPHACTECQRSFPAQDMITFRGAWVCAECKPRFFQRLQESGETASQLVYAGFWVRFVAKFLDGLILAIPSLVISTLFSFTSSPFTNPSAGDDVNFFPLLLQGIQQLLGISITLAYTTWFLGRYGATPGKMAMNLRVVRPDGSPLSYQRALGRTAAEYISSIILCIGYIIAAFDEEKRSLHDRIADTRVVRK